MILVQAMMQENQSEHDRLVEETRQKMAPDECPKLNRSQSTRNHNRNEIVKLTMWLFHQDNHEDIAAPVTTSQAAGLIHPLLVNQIKHHSTTTT
jgi:hypothetical protein